MRPLTMFVDGMCLFHRAKSGFVAGDHFVTFNFIRSLRSLISQLAPTRVVIAMEGSKAARVAIDPAYKSNRRSAGSSFYEQVAECVALLSEHFPVSVVSHPELEADDVIAKMIRSSASGAVDSVIVSTDRDYLQLVAERDSVKLFDPVKKEFLRPGVSSDFLTWRALVGDASDCVPRLFPDEQAAKLAADDAQLTETLAADASLLERFALNVKLLSFAEPSDGDDGWLRMTCSSPKRDWDAVALQFAMWEFKSILSDMPKFIAAFEPLWVSRAS